MNNINQSQDFFEKNGYVILKDVLPKEQCDTLVKHMFKLFEEGKTVKDDQCPLSDAVYGDPIFDNLLQKFAEPLSKNLGKKLLPTYTYARIYRPGEVLKKHKDRPACEISTTLTLGYDATNSWPIFMDEHKEIPVIMEAGEMVAYRGCDIVHWRPAFKGNWHVQVFFHYVDANGPHKDHYKDGREKFGVQKHSNVELNNTVNKTISNTETEVFTLDKLPFKTYSTPIFNGVIIPSKDEFLPGYICMDNTFLPELKFTKEECERIKLIAEQSYASSASIGGNSQNSKIDKSIRSANIFYIDNTPDNRWIFEKVSSLVSIVNTFHFDYEISGIFHGIQLIHYTTDLDKPGHYDWHVDAGNGNVATRKISFTAQLSDPSEYEGCDLVINNHGTDITGTREQGSIHMFPSYMLHQVTNITKGERYALVIWIQGSRRFR